MLVLYSVLVEHVNHVQIGDNGRSQRSHDTTSKAHTLLGQRFVELNNSQFVLLSLHLDFFLCLPEHFLVLIDLPHLEFLIPFNLLLVKGLIEDSVIEVLFVDLLFKAGDYSDVMFMLLLVFVVPKEDVVLFLLLLRSVLIKHLFL
jgi:hypothetical protein